jgi:peptidoglycan/xylan/chitin deacetylase (PgdA/CDA1 family)
MLWSAIAASAAAGTAVFGGVHAFMPASQLYGRTFLRSTDQRQLALTYDDGPNDPHTLNLLDILAEFDVKATFFLIGKHVAARPDIVARISAAGHCIGNHTYSHPNLALCSAQRTQQEISDCAKALTDAAPSLNDKGTPVFRCPFGARRPVTLRTVRSLGFVPVQWTVTCFDWKKTTAERVAGHAQKQIKGGDVVLLHDGGHKRIGEDRSHSVQATRTLLQHYKNEGFAFVTIPEMMSVTAL